MDRGRFDLAHLFPAGDRPVTEAEVGYFVECVGSVAPGSYLCRPLDEKRQIAIDGDLFGGRARVGIGPRGLEVYDLGQVWEFPSYRVAVRAWATYRPDQTEPEGWDRHLETDGTVRYRLGGDARCEFWKDASLMLHATGPDVLIVDGEARRRVVSAATAEE